MQHTSAIGTLLGSMNPWKHVIKEQRNKSASYYSLPYRTNTSDPMSCQCEQNAAFDGATSTYRRALWWVVLINAGMFLIEVSGGWLSGSKALQADALDFLGDTLTYLISLLVIGKALRLRSKVALFKGLTLGLMGLWVLGSTLYRAFHADTGADTNGEHCHACLLRQPAVSCDSDEVPRWRCKRPLSLVVQPQ